MALQHDAQGFLAGDPIDIGRALAIWQDIQKNVTAIKHALTAASSSWDSAGRGRPNVSALPTGRDIAGPIDGASGAGRAPALPAIRNAAALNENRPARATARINLDGAPALPAGRDGNGRINGGGLDEVDPAAKAFTEVAQPIARGYQMITGNRDEKRREGWYRRIFGELKIFRKEEGLFAKLASRRLKGIDERPAPDGGGESGGMWAAAIAAMLGIGPAIKAALGFLLSKIPFIGKLFKGAAGGAGGVPPAGGLAAGMGKFLKRIPLLGALIGGVGAATDIYGSENDDTLTRREKDKNAGKATGGFAGSMAGMAAGAALGAFGGPVGMAIGGMVGMFLGDQAGQIIGDTMGGWVNDLRGADIPGRIASAWDATTGAIKSGWDGAMTGFKSVQEGISKGWNGFVDIAKAGWATITGLFSAAYEGLKSIPIIGDAIRAVEESAKKVAETARSVSEKTAKTAGEVKQVATEKAKEVAGSVKEKVVTAGSQAVGFAKQGAEWVGDNTTAGKGVKAAWNGAKNVAASLADGVKNKVVVRRAIETGADYRQGNIAGLDDTHTRALVASTAATESAGGKLDVVNSAGYMGRYQAGAGWLADAGKIKGGSEAVRSAMKSDGFSSEYKWGESGGMTKFLKNDKNWNGDMNYDKYLASADAQDGAFKASSDKSYQSLVKKGVITKDMSQDDIAGILKARHIGGEGGAAKAAKGISGPADANGTTALKYKNDLAAGNVYAKAFSSPSTTTAAPAAPNPATVIAASATAAPKPATATAAAPVNPTKEAETKVASLDDDPSQGGRLEYKDLGGGDISVTDAESGITDIATAEQEKAYRKQKGREYKAQIASVNDPESYKPGGVHSGGKVALNAGPNMIMAPAAPAVASVPAPAISVAPVAPAMAEAPPVVAPLASGDSKKSGTTSYANPDASQDLKDRRIAHIATGGFST